MDFKIETIEVHGINISLIAAGNAMRTEMQTDYEYLQEKDYKRGVLLGNTETGAGHDNFLNGIKVYFNIYAPLFMWKEIQRYHFLDFISSQSTMHKLTKFKIADQCVSDTDPRVIEICQSIIDEYNKKKEEGIEDKDLWRKAVASIPSGFVLGATMITNYRQLKTMYFQRKNHKLKEWHEFCDWCETLPMFKELVLNNKE